MEKLKYGSIKASVKSDIIKIQELAKNELLEELEKSKEYKNDTERFEGYQMLLLEVLLEYLRTKSSIDDIWLHAISQQTLSKECNDYLDEAIECLRKKEYLDRSLADVNERISRNDAKLTAIKDYYEAREKK